MYFDTIYWNVQLSRMFLLISTQISDSEIHWKLMTIVISVWNLSNLLTTSSYKQQSFVTIVQVNEPIVSFVVYGIEQ
jgi:hypothetical protein